MSANLKKLSELSKRGPHRVMEGDLGFTGLPGKVYVPAEGKAVPGIAFGHDWMKSVGDYHKTLRHLASWGIAVAAPDTERDLRPNHAGFAADLVSALQILAGVKMGNGNVTISPNKLGIAGHGMGAGCAVLAAEDNPQVKAVAAIYPADVAPSSIKAARGLFKPGMVIGPDDDSDGILGSGNPAKLAYNWSGPVVYRTVKNGNQQAFSEDSLAKLLLGTGRTKTSVQETVRALITGYFLHQLGGEKVCSGYSEEDASGKGVESVFGHDLAEQAGLADGGAISLF
ncbi:dienelactone hydrolase family protein [Corynebacterium meitnerae]|uniref:Dienelactone hydrolase family protein n=1 Tax=Corynebacterium meitnerae TaxID=2913498 RepID=A0A9X3LWI6_9CORY|nr:dienelactone hydrolase family protein [Corynebacterium meitnerae]